MLTLKKRVLSEFLASFILGFMGLGLVVPLSVHHYISDLYQFSMLFGLIIAFVIIVFNPISGAQFNPGVTLAMVLSGRQDKKELLPFCLAQVGGWALGSGCIYLMFWNELREFASSEAGNPVNLFFCHTSDIWSGVWLEFFGTAMMLVVICACIDKRIINKPGNALFPFAIALYILFVVAFTGGYTGTALNMARDFGPRISGFVYGLLNGYDVSQCFADGVWILYFFAPACGAVAGTFFFDKVVSKLLPKAQEETR